LGPGFLAYFNPFLFRGLRKFLSGVIFLPFCVFFWGNAGSKGTNVLGSLTGGKVSKNALDQSTPIGDEGKKRGLSAVRNSTRGRTPIYIVRGGYPKEARALLGE